MSKKDDSDQAGAKAEKTPKEPKEPKKGKPDKAKADQAGAKKEKAPQEPKSTTPVAPPRKRQLYKEQAAPALMKRFSYKNPMQIPRLSKITINMGLGAAITNPKIMDSAVEELRAITGQKPVVTRAKKAIANFKLREGLAIGAMVTLRRERMWEFFDRLVSLALPRVRDFKGVNPRGFDGQGNYTLGLKEQIVFPEIDYDKIDAIKGINISFITTAKTDEEGHALLAQLGMPFRA
jgi:large subunit ribosomal protein L5